MEIIKKSTLNKKVKFDSLLDQGLELLKKNGLANTSIDQITKKAGVAKGTFYLYFKNKEDFTNQIIFKINMDILEDCMIKAKNVEDPIDFTLSVLGYLVSYYSKNPSILKTIFKHSSWSDFAIRLQKNRQSQSLLKTFQRRYRKLGMNAKTANYTLFIIIQLTASICYESVINKVPAPIEIMGEVLKDTTRKILTN